MKKLLVLRLIGGGDVQLKRFEESKAALFAVMGAITLAMVALVQYKILLDRLGSHLLGVWAIVAAGTSLARFAELGLGGAVVRLVAVHVQKKKMNLAAIEIELSTITVFVTVGALSVLMFPALLASVNWALGAESQPAVKVLLATSLASLTIASAANIIGSSLDALGLVHWRVLVNISASIFGLSAIWLLVRPGEDSLIIIAIIQTIQAILVLVVGSTILKTRLPKLRVLNPRWRFTLLKRNLSNLINFQLSSLGAALLDPILKFLIGRYAGTSSVAYYELAAQLHAKVKSLYISAIQSLVGRMARLNAVSNGNLKDGYFRQIKMVSALFVPTYIAFLGFVPLITDSWVPTHANEVISVALVLGWGHIINVQMLPAYFGNQATGRVLNNTIHQLMQGAVCAIGMLLGSSLGLGAFAPIYVVAGISIASIYVIYRFNQELEISWKRYQSESQFWTGLAAGAIFAGVGLHMINMDGRTEDAASTVLALIGLAICGLLVLRQLDAIKEIIRN